MARRRYLVAYDIREDHRLRAVATCAESYGYRIQYSVFICDLSEQEVIVMRGELETIAKTTEDSIMIVDLGSPSDAGKFVFLGPHRTLPTNTAVII